MYRNMYEKMHQGLVIPMGDPYLERINKIEELRSVQSYSSDDAMKPFFMRVEGKKYSREAGFTLMELLIVLALVAVISMIAVPIYRGYVQNARITEGLTLASSIQLDAEVFYTLNSRWPSIDNAHTELRLANPTDYEGNSVESLTLEANKITVVYNDTVVGENAEADVKLILTAQVSEGGVIRWQCEGENIDSGNLPTECSS